MCFRSCFYEYNAEVGHESQISHASEERLVCNLNRIAEVMSLI